MPGSTSLALTTPVPPTIVEPEVTYVASTVPAKALYVSGTTLFRIAASQFGDALMWGSLASMNSLLDPWLVGQEIILVPPVPPTIQTGGIYAPISGPSISSQLAPPLVPILPQSVAQPLGMP